jgi:PAS domain S-box-containing protein
LPIFTIYHLSVRGTETEENLCSSQPISEAALGEAILRSEADAVIAADRDGIIHLWNPGAVRLFGYARHEALGRSLDLIIPERLRAHHWAGYRNVMDVGESRYGRGDVLAVPGMRKDGSRISWEFTITPLRNDDGRMLGMVAVMRDVTTRFEELRALRQKLSHPAQRSGSSE